MENEKLIEKLVDDFREKLTDIFIKEQKESEFLPQEAFENCKARAKKAYEMATENGVKMLGLAIAKHRKEKHGDDVESEKEELESGLSSSDISAALSSSGWSA